MNKAERESGDRMIYNMYTEYLADGLGQNLAKHSVAYQQGLSFKVVNAAIRRHVLASR